MAEIKIAKEYSLKRTLATGSQNTNSPFSRSPVNIIIPFYEQYDKVTSLVSSILLATRSNPYQICLVDDASPNKEFISSFIDYITTPQGCLSQIITIQNEEQLGFGGALQKGFEATNQPWVVFMHSDCRVETAGWLIEMGRSLQLLKDDGVKMISPKTNHPENSRLRGEKGEISSDIILEKGCLPLYCAMCHRELFQHIQGFIKSYPYGWYEDEELAYRMKSHGYKQAVCGNSWVYHEGGATVNAICQQKPEVKDIMEENRNRCLSDMGSLIF